jgi:PIN domain nuclease of toxin-antitoxin system
LVLSQPFKPWMTKAIFDLRAVLLPITVEYADAQLSLPSHHRDPFDRLTGRSSTGRSAPVRRARRMRR